VYNDNTFYLPIPSANEDKRQASIKYSFKGHPTKHQQS